MREDMHASLRDIAERNHRSLNAEITHILSQHIHESDEINKSQGPLGLTHEEFKMVRLYRKLPPASQDAWIQIMLGLMSE